MKLVCVLFAIFHLVYSQSQAWAPVSTITDLDADSKNKIISKMFYFKGGIGYYQIISFASNFDFLFCALHSIN
jgi:hypothetical protein